MTEVETEVDRVRERLSRPLTKHVLALPVELDLPRGLHQAALELADAHSLPSVYDAYYVALARMLGCDLWTADRGYAFSRRLQLEAVGQALVACRPAARRGTSPRPTSASLLCRIERIGPSGSFANSSANYWRLDG